jgi:hypothetical protein
MSDLKATTLNINVIGDGALTLKPDIPITAYTDESGTVSRVTIHVEELVKLAIYMATHYVETFVEQVDRQGKQIRDLQNLQIK